MRRIRFLSSVFLAVLGLVLLQTNLQPLHAVAPATPTNVTVRASANMSYLNGTVTVDWDRVVGATQYSVKLTRAGSTTAIGVSVNGERNNQAIIAGLVGGVTYVVQVASVLDQEVSAWSANTLTITPVTLPKQPAKPTSVPDVGSATVSWTPLTASENGGSDVTSYRITEINSGASISAAADASSISFTNLTEGAKAIFSVTAITAASSTGTTSAASDEVTILTAGSVSSSGSAPTDVVVAPQPTPTATSSGSAPAPAPIVIMGGGGGFAPTPIISASPSPTPTPTLSAPPIPTASPTPTVVATPSPLTSGKGPLAPSPLPSPSASSNPFDQTRIVVKTNSFAVAQPGAKVVGVVKQTTVSAPVSTVTIKSNTNYQPILPTVKKGTPVTVVVKDASGRSYTIAQTTAGSTGSLKLPAIKLSQTGSYTLTIKVGNTTKKVTIKTTK